jgi:hypothetical protein
LLRTVVAIAAVLDDSGAEVAAVAMVELVHAAAIIATVSVATVPSLHTVRSYTTDHRRWGFGKDTFAATGSATSR